MTAEDRERIRQAVGCEVCDARYPLRAYRGRMICNHCETLERARNVDPRGIFRRRCKLCGEPCVGAYCHAHSWARRA